MGVNLKAQKSVRKIQLIQSKRDVSMEEDSDRSYSQVSVGWHYDEEESSPRGNSDKKKDKQQRINKDLNDLHKAKDRFKDFLVEIGDLKKTPIREDILQYCGSQKKSEKSIESYPKPEALLKKIEIRIDKMLKTKRIKRNWGEQDLKILIWVISKYCDLRKYVDLEKQITDQDWRMIASVIPGVSPNACMFKWLSLKKITLAAHNWTKEESDILSNIVNERLQRMGNTFNEIKDWKQISQELYRLNGDQRKVYRNAKQCREHWTCYLSPQLKKGPWQLHEDIKLLKFIKDNKGLKKWSEIAKNFDGRTENALKNRYTLIIDKQKRSLKNKGKPELDLICQYLQKCIVDEFTAHVKVEQQESIYEQNSQTPAKEQPQPVYHTPVKKEEYNNNCDTNQSVITPVRVERVCFNDLESMSFQFFKNIQPGIMSSGTFKKIFSMKEPVREDHDFNCKIQSSSMAMDRRQ